MSLLRKKILQKISNILALGKKFDFLHCVLQQGSSFIDFTDVHLQFSGQDDKVLKHKSTIRQKKFTNVLKDKKPQDDREKIIFNYSCYVLSEADFIRGFIRSLFF